MADRELSIRLRKEGRITTPGDPFEASDAAEIDALLASGTIVPIQMPTNMPGRVFRSRLVREVKGKNTDHPYEKSRLVVQGYNDEGKRDLLTQSPTIQRSSQRLLLALAPSLRARGFKLAFRDITQAYVQSRSTLQRDIIAKLPKELVTKFAEGTVLHIVKPLYGIAEAGVHWFETYQSHLRENLALSQTFDPCLLVSDEGKAFGLCALQTDDTMFLADESFLTAEEEAI